MPHKLYDMMQTVDDEKSFVAFLAAMVEDIDEHERSGRHDPYSCIEGDHFRAQSTRQFLRSMEEWARDGDFAAGRHYGDPILRRVATMLYVGRHPLREDE